MCKLYENIRIIALGCLCLVFVGCSSYAPYRYMKDGIDSIFDDMISYTEAIMSKFKD